jgi:hypothetical protein
MPLVDDCKTKENSNDTDPIPPTVDPCERQRSITKSFGRRGSMPSTSSRQSSFSNSTSKRRGSMSSSSSITTRPNTHWTMNSSMYGQVGHSKETDTERELLDFHNLNIDISNNMESSYSSMEQSFTSMSDRSYSRPFHDSSTLGSIGKLLKSTTNQPIRQSALLHTNAPLRSQSNGYQEEKIRHKSMLDTRERSQTFGSSIVKAIVPDKPSSKILSPSRYSEIYFSPLNDEISTDSGNFDIDLTPKPIASYQNKQSRNEYVVDNSLKSVYPSIVAVPTRDDIHIKPSMNRQQRQQHQPQNQSQKQNETMQQSQHQTPHFIELMPGYHLPLLGAHHTQEALRNKRISACQCLSCGIPLCCCDDAEYVLCPDCLVVSPVDSSVSSKNIERGVGLGVKTMNLSQSQRHILIQ